jgi:hypothetical protein
VAVALFRARHLDSCRHGEWNAAGLSEAFMQDYEIRIFGANKDHGRRGHTIIEMMHLNDSTALRSARSLAAGRPFEVWRGLERIDFEAGTVVRKPLPGPAA